LASLEIIRNPGAALLASVDAACFDQPWSEEDYASLLSNPAVGGWVFSAEDGPAGLVFWQCTGEEAELYRLGIDPGKRRRGHGSALLALWLDYMRSCGTGRIWLELRAGNEPARGLYVGHGFRQVARRGGYYPDGPGGGREDALILELALGQEG